MTHHFVLSCGAPAGAAAAVLLGTAKATLGTATSRASESRTTASGYGSAIHLAVGETVILLTLSVRPY